MATIYKRSKSQINYFSDREVEPPKKKLDAIEELREDFPEHYESMLAAIKAQAEDGEEVEATLEALKNVSNRYEFLAPLARETRSAQVAMAVALLNEKPKAKLEEHVVEIKKATGATWQNLRDWCNEPAEPGAGNKKSNKLRVATAAVRALDEEIQKGKDAAAARRAKAAENKARKEAEAAARK